MLVDAQGQLLILNDPIVVLQHYFFLLNAHLRYKCHVGAHVRCSPQCGVKYMITWLADMRATPAPNTIVIVIENQSCGTQDKLKGVRSPPGMFHRVCMPIVPVAH